MEALLQKTCVLYSGDLPPVTETEIAELQPYINRIFDKPYYSAFTEKFSSFILINQISKIYLCGVETDSCILKTAIDSFERGIEPVIIEDACFSDGG